MADSYYAAGYWGAREECVDSCAGRLGEFLGRLRSRHRLLGTWYELGDTLQEARQRQVAPRLDELRRHLLAGRNRTDSEPREVIERLGYSFDVWNGQDDADAGLMVHCGCYARRVGNSCVIDLPDVLVESEALYRVGVARSVMRDLVECWEPDWATWTSRRLREEQSGQRGKVVAGFATYLSPALACRVQSLPDRVVSEQVGEGVLFTLGDDPRDVPVENMLALRRALSDVP